MIINLNEDFQPFGGIVPKYWTFPSGAEIGVKLPADLPPDNVATIVARLNSSEEIVKLLMLTDALRRKKIDHLDLRLSYLSYARQDRKCDDGESFSLKVVADLLNRLRYRHIEILDVHSEVSTALICNSICVSNHKFVAKVLENQNDYLLISPDAGSYKKIFGVASYLGYTDEIVCCNKVRDITNGKIKKMAVVSETSLENRRCVIVDDIISKGGTFIGLAQELKKKGASRVELIVTHHENSADESKLREGLDHVYTTNSFCDMVSNDFTTQFSLSSEIW